MNWLTDAGIEDPGPIAGDPACPHLVADSIQHGGEEVWRCTICELVFRAELELVYGDESGPRLEWLDLEPIGLAP